MNLSRICIAIGAVLGLIGVITGALGAHALEETLGDKLASYETAVRYQMYHALAFIVLGVMAARAELRGLTIIAWFWALGVLLFSGSIYLLVLTPLKVGIVTPIGGLLMIVGWAILLVSALRKN